MNSKRKDEILNHIENILPIRIDFINIVKIIIVSFIAFYLLENFVPFYEGDDSSIFAFTSIQLSKGEYTITNELLEETGDWSFIPRHWTKTIHNTAIPKIELGFPTIGAFVYLIAGNNGLFYLNPIIATIFFIVADRIATNLFGRLVGLFTILFLASSFWIIQFASFTMSDMLFVLVFIIGCFYFLKYLNEPVEKYLLISSSIFVASTFIRIIGIVFFLVEILVVLSLIIYSISSKNKYNIISKNLTQNASLTSISFNRSIKIIFSIIGPWSLFFLFLFSYNDYYFGNPLTMKEVVMDPSDLEPLEDQTLLLIIPENIMGYLRAVLPFPFSHDIEPIDRSEDFLGKYWIGFLTPVLLGTIFLVSFKKNIKRMEITVFTIFLLSIILLYSALPSAESQLERNTSQRYSIPAFTLFSMMIGFMIIEILQFNSRTTSNQPIFLKSFKIIVIISLVIFFIMAFYYTLPFQAISNGNFKFQNPEVFSAKYPLDNEGLTSQSIVLDSEGYRTADRGIIPLRSLYPTFDPQYFGTSPISQELILQVKNLMGEGYDVFVYKKPSNDIDKLYFRYIVENNDLTLKSHSQSFCKFYFSENLQTKSDEDCL